MIKLSIIVPVYNVEEYIRPCFESIFKQGLDEECFEVIIVNDGTEDRSMEMIQDIIEQHKNITIINQENLSLSVARNNGIEKAKGQYILMPDSDDLLIENSLKPLIEIAVESQPDLVVADFLRMTNEEIENLTTIQQKDFTIQEKTGEQLLLEDLNPYECYVWRTLYRREFLNNENIRFYPGIRFQDVPFTHECYLKAKKCLKVTWLLNIYRKWSGASTNSFDLKKAKDFCVAISETWKLTQIENLSAQVQTKLRDDIFMSLSLLFWRLKYDLHNLTEKMEVINYMKCQAPDLSFKHGIKQRAVTFLYRWCPLSYLAFRDIYGSVFENRIRPLYRTLLKKINKRKDG